LRAALLRGHWNAACEVEQAWRSGEQGALAFYAEHDLIALSEAKRVPHNFRNCQLALRRELRRNIHFILLTHRMK